MAESLPKLDAKAGLVRKGTVKGPDLYGFGEAATTTIHPGPTMAI